MEMQAEAERPKRGEILQSEGDEQSEISLVQRRPQDCDSAEQQSSAQDPGAHSQPKSEDVTSKESFNKVKIRLGEINKYVSDGINEDREHQKGRRSSASPKLVDTFQHVISNIEKKTAKNIAFLQKEIDTRKSNSSCQKEDLKVKSLQRTVSMMKRTTEQITDVTR